MLLFFFLQTSNALAPNQGSIDPKASIEEIEMVHRNSTYFEIYFTGISRHASQNKINTTVHNPKKKMNP